MLIEIAKSVPNCLCAQGIDIDKKLSIFINGQLVAAGFSLRMWLGIRTYSPQPEGCGYLENNGPEGATYSGRSPGRGVDSYMFKSENLSLTFCPLTPSLSPLGRREGGEGKFQIFLFRIYGRRGSIFHDLPV